MRSPQMHQNQENLAQAGRDQLQRMEETVVGAVHEQGGAPDIGASNSNREVAEAQRSGPA